MQVGENVPLALIVPVIAPVLELILSPVGRPEQAYVDAEQPPAVRLPNPLACVFVHGPSVVGVSPQPLRLKAFRLKLLLASVVTPVVIVVVWLPAVHAGSWLV